MPQISGLKDRLPPLLALIIGSILIYWAWGRSGELLLDFGRELYCFWRISQGDHLYQQIDYRFGPLATYANGLWMWMFGPGIQTVLVANLVVLIVTCLLLYALLVKMADVLTASVGIILFLCKFGVGTGTALTQYNFLTPYNHGAIYGFMLTLAALMFVERYARDGKIWNAAVAGLFTGLCFLTKPEMFLGCAAAVGCGLVAGAVISRHCLWRMIVVTLLASAVPPIVAFAALSRIMPADVALAGTMGGWQFMSNASLVQSPFYKWCMGTDYLRRNILLMLAGTLAYMVLIGVGVLIAGAPRSRARMLSAIAGCALGIAMVVKPRGIGYFERALPVGMAAAVLVWGWRLWSSRRGGSQASLVLRFSFAILSLVLLFKIFFAARTAHYGFVLAAPAFVTGFVILFDAIPRKLMESGRNPWAFRAIGIGLIAGIVIHRLAVTDGRYRDHNTVIHLALGGKINLMAPEPAAPGPGIEQIAGFIPPGATLDVFPDSAGLNYATGRASSIPFTVFNPFELQMTGEKTVLDALKAKPPGYIAIVATDESDYGAATFGVEFGVLIGKWIAANYERVVITPNETRTDVTPITVYKRR